MHLELLVEEPSAETALQNLLPKVLGPTVSFRIHPHQGKRDLIHKLPARLRGYKRWLPAGAYIVVLVDADRQDCRQLKAKLDEMVNAAGLKARTHRGRDDRFTVLNRLAIEELEAWFFGDVEALRAAYPRLPSSLATRAPYRNPDDIRGGTWETLERELQRVGYHRGGLAKIEAARAISAHMDPVRNRSRSFRTFREGLLSLSGSG